MYNVYKQNVSRIEMIFEIGTQLLCDPNLKSQTSKTCEGHCNIKSSD